MQIIIILALRKKNNASKYPKFVDRYTLIEQSTNTALLL